MRVTIAELIAGLVLIAAIEADAQHSKGSELSAAQVAAVVSEVGEQYRREYLIPAIGEEVRQSLRRRLARGEYEGLDASVLAKRLTADLQVVTGNVHSYVKHQPNDQSSRGTPALPQGISGPGIDRVERLAGNIGFIHVALFTIPPSFSKSVDRAMAELSDTRALIIDIRDTPGGSSQSVAYLSSYFFDPKQRVHLNSFIYRKAPTVEEWTQAVPLPYLHKKVLVLTSRRTGSGAEGFAYQMQAFGRARTVGERTEGGAHTGQFTSVGNGLSVFVPTGYALNPLTKKNWEKVGVLPDVPSEAHEALQTALEHL
jgi:Peptidase family S41/N-terminal domain of Peptidase_S41 in eukaryotic IRBP